MANEVRDILRGAGTVTGTAAILAAAYGVFSYAYPADAATINGIIQDEVQRKVVGPIADMSANVQDSVNGAIHEAGMWTEGVYNGMIDGLVNTMYVGIGVGLLVLAFRAFIHRHHSRKSASDAGSSSQPSYDTDDGFHFPNI